MDPTWQATRFSFKNCIAYACVLLCHFFSVIFWASAVFVNKYGEHLKLLMVMTLCGGHILLLAIFVAYFLKKNYSWRQIILKTSRVWERSLISVPLGVYLNLIEVRIWLGESVAKKGVTAASSQYIRRRYSCWRKIGRWTVFRARQVWSWICV